MSMTTKTEAPKQKKNVGYRLLAALVFIACVAVLFLPISTFTSAWAIEKQTLIKTIKAIFASDVKMFGVLPVLVAGNGILAISANVALYLFALAIVVAVICSFIAIFARKKAPGLIRTALFLYTWGCAAYALSILCISDYINNVKVTFDVITIAIAVAGALFYFFLMLAKIGKAAWLCAVHFLLSLAVSGLLILAMTFDGSVTSKALAANKLFKWILVGVVGFAMLNLVIATIRALSKKGLSGDMVRYVLQLLVSLVACYASYGAKIESNLYLLLVVLAAVVSVIQIIIATLQLGDRAKKRAAAAKEEALSNFETEEYVEAYAYEGGPVAGVVVAEEVSPTAAAQAAANGQKPDMASLVGNGFDPFMYTLSEAQKTEFIDLYILRCKGMMPEIPAYVVGGDNKDFFNKVFIYLGQYREKISSDLLAKMYEFSMKLQ